jgi:hypothetical protein
MAGNRKQKPFIAPSRPFFRLYNVLMQSGQTNMQTKQTNQNQTVKPSKYTEDELTTFQTCTKCNISKPLSFYYRLGTVHEKVCKDCRNLRENTYTPEPASVEVPKKRTAKKKK